MEFEMQQKKKGELNKAALANVRVGNRNPKPASKEVPKKIAIRKQNAESGS